MKGTSIMRNFGLQKPGITVFILVCAAAILFSGCSDTVTPPEKKSFSFSMAVVDTLGNPIEGLRIGRQNYIDGCVTGPFAGMNQGARLRRDIVQPQQVFALMPNYPNPFGFTTSIRYSLAQNCHVALNTYDWQGSLVRRIVDYVQIAGVHTVAWSGNNNSGIRVHDGFYTYKITAREVASGSILFERELICTVYNSIDSHPLFTEIGQTDAGGLFETSDVSFFPFLQGYGTRACYDDTGDEVGTFSFVDSVRIIISYLAGETDTTATYYRNFQVISLTDETNSFEFTWTVPADTATFDKNLY